MTQWGYHLLLDCARGNVAAITDKENISRFVDELVVAIDMVPYGDTWIEHFATHDPNKAGFSMFQMIETSNISGHFVDKTGDFYIDVFSCKEFRTEIVVGLVEKYFSPKNITQTNINRTASL
jgi:S-adenosylmethionine/arginine decarboxylase-like enzyme